MFHLFIEEMLSPIRFVTKNVWFFFWLTVNICSKLPTINGYFKIPTFFIDEHHT